jgi:REP element-mobilizing transposase RayT
MNRGIARRTTFEGIADYDAFTDALLRVTRGGWLEVHAYSAMVNHFHLLVRSERGTVSEGMRRLGSLYVRTFNRLRERDGALFRGRFTSRPVTNEAYWYTVLRYIDRNPVAAGLARDPTEYPRGSAWWYARASGPPWLRRDVVEGAVRADAGRRVYDPSDYREFSAAGDMEWQRDLVERRTARPPAASDPLDWLLSAPRDRITHWMQQASRLADGTASGAALVGPAALSSVLDRSPDPLSEDAKASLRVGLLRAGAGMTELELSRHLQRTRHWVRSRLEGHRSLLRGDARYREIAERTLRESLAATLGRRAPLRVLSTRKPTNRRIVSDTVRRRVVSDTVRR